VRAFGASNLLITEASGLIPVTWNNDSPASGYFCTVMCGFQTQPAQGADHFDELHL